MRIAHIAANKSIHITTFIIKAFHSFGFHIAIWIPHIIIIITHAINIITISIFERACTTAGKAPNAESDQPFPVFKQRPIKGKFVFRGIPLSPFPPGPYLQSQYSQTLVAIHLS